MCSKARRATCWRRKPRFPDFTWTIEQIIGDGDRVAVMNRVGATRSNAWRTLHLCHYQSFPLSLRLRHALPDFETLEDAGLLSKERPLTGNIPAGLANDGAMKPRSRIWISSSMGCAKQAALSACLPICLGLRPLNHLWVEVERVNASVDDFYERRCEITIASERRNSTGLAT